MLSAHRLASSVPLEVAPQALDGVEVGGVAGEAFDDQPAALAADPGLHAVAAVGGQPVPDQGDLGAVEFVVQRVEELDEGLVVVGAGAGLEHDARL